MKTSTFCHETSTILRSSRTLHPAAEEDGILSAIGKTPLIRLRRMYGDAEFKLYAKLEATNPGGSVKDRSAISIVRQAIADGRIRAGTTVVESSSGNMAIGLAQACLYNNLHFICVVDAKTTAQNVRLLQAYGAQVDIVMHADPETGEYLAARLNRVHLILRDIKGSYWPNQYANPDNANAHHETMKEIVAQLDGQVDYLFVATGTCGTLRGCADYVRGHSLSIRIVAVDAVGSVIFGKPRGQRRIPGHGAAIVPALFRDGLADELVQVDDVDCIAGCRRLMRREAILAGGSSGAVMTAIERTRDCIPRGANCVAICADRGERYLDTIFCDEWVNRVFGDVADRWKS